MCGWWHVVSKCWRMSKKYYRALKDEALRDQSWENVDPELEELPWTCLSRGVLRGLCWVVSKCCRMSQKYWCVWKEEDELEELPCVCFEEMRNLRWRVQTRGELMLKRESVSCTCLKRWGIRGMRSQHVVSNVDHEPIQCCHEVFE